MSEDRIKEIRHTLANEEGNHRYAYEEDVSHLLKRVEELEAENGELKNKVGRLAKRLLRHGAR
jgi:hypothetical protein